MKKKSADKTIYYILDIGQLGNQLAVLAHLIAFANIYGYNLVFPNSEALKANLDIRKYFLVRKAIFALNYQKIRLLRLHVLFIFVDFLFYFNAVLFPNC